MRLRTIIPNNLLPEVIKRVIQAQAKITTYISLETFEELSKIHLYKTCDPTHCLFCEIDREVEAYVYLRLKGLEVLSE